MATKTAVEKKGPGSKEPFSFTTSVKDDEGNPVVITVPSLAVVKPNGFKVHKLRKADPTGFSATDYLLCLALGDDAEDVLDFLADLPGAEASSFQDEWTEHSGASLGEFKAS